MLEFKQDDREAIFIVTLTERVTINDPYFLFVFIHVLTKSVVAFVISSVADESDFLERYNQFSIRPDIEFHDQPIGEWHYTIYQQFSATNTNPALTGDALEYGKLIIERSPAFAYKIYDEPTIINAYNG